MSRYRNAVALLILCFLGGYGYNRFYTKQSTNALNLSSFSSQNLRDSVAQNPSGQGHKGGSSLTFGEEGNEDLKDSVAESPAIATGRGIGTGQQPGNSGHNNGNNQNPRGGSFGSIGGGGHQNPGAQLQYKQNNPPPTLSPSGPK